MKDEGGGMNTCSSVGGAENARDQPLDAAVDNRAHAHQAGFKGNVKGAAQTIILNFFGCLADGINLGMAGWVVCRYRAVATPAENLTISYQDCAHRDFTFCGRNST